MASTTDRVGNAPSPCKAQRKPCNAPTIGFNSYIKRQRAGTELIGYATGVAKNQNCTRKLTVWRTSRNLTLSAESHRPAPSEDRTTGNTKSGKSATAAVGLIRKHARNKTSTGMLTAKSSRLAAIDERGASSRG